MTLTVRRRLLFACIVLAAFLCMTLVGCSSSGGPTIKKASAGDEEDSGTPGAKTPGSGTGMPGGGMPGMGGGAGMPGMGMPGMSGGGMPGMGMPGMAGGAGTATAAAPTVVAELPPRSTVTFQQMVAGIPITSTVVNGKTVLSFVFKDFYKQPWKCLLPKDASTGSQPKEVWTNTFIAYKRSIIDPNKRKSVIVNKSVDGFPFISPPPARTASAAGTGTGMPMMGAGMGMGMGGRMPGMGGGAGMPGMGMPGMGMGGAMPGMGMGAMRPGMGGAGGGLPGMPGMTPPR